MATSETAVIARNPGDRSDFRKLKAPVLLLVVWEFFMVLFASLFSPPMGSVSQTLGVSSSLMGNFPLLDSMFFHSLALPLAAVLAVVTVGAFGVRGRLRSFIVYAAAFGGVTSSGLMAYILLTGGDTVSYYLMYLTTSVEALAALALLVALIPKRDGSAGMRLLGRDLTAFAMWVVTAGAVVAVSMGEYASWGNGQWNPSTTLAEMSGLETVHQNLIMTIIGAAIVVIAARWFMADTYRDTAGLFVKVGLCGIIVGVPVVVASMLAIASSEVGPMGGITALEGVLLEASLFLMFAMMYGEARRLRVRNPVALLRESLTFGMLFVFFWVNVAVTLPGVYVAANLARFNGQYLGFYYRQVFVIGHEHALVTLTAISLMMLVALMFNVKGVLGALAGTTMTAGYVICTVANVLFMFFLIPNGSTFIEYMSDGIALMFLGVLLATVGMLLSGRGPRRSAASV